MAKKLFDFAIGNPPYQEEFSTDGNKTYAAPVYNDFMDAANDVADKVELIHPARFLFNAGSTPKAWNEKMLNDPHFKILRYEADASKVFPNTSINGGVAVSYHNSEENYGAIEIFCKFNEMNSILQKVFKRADFNSMEEIVVTRTAFHLTDKMHADFPDAINRLSKGHAYDMSSNIFERIPNVFNESKPTDGHNYIRIYGRLGTMRTYRYIRKDYVNDVSNLYSYKVITAAADGAAGQIGQPIPARIMGKPMVAEPGVGYTESFISIGTFKTIKEANALEKYVRTKFARTMLGILKVTQHITPIKWKYVPLQDFTDKSDLDWSKSIHEIDLQLYRKYGLSVEEINFIETHVKEMI